MNQPKDIANFLKRRQQALAWLCSEFPETFFIVHVRPLKTGIYHDIFAVKKEGMPTKKWMAAALRYYTRSRAYLNSLTENASRIDLQGQEARLVTLDESNSAKNRLKQQYCSRKKYTSKKMKVTEKPSVATFNEEPFIVTRKILSLNKKPSVKA